MWHLVIDYILIHNLIYRISSGLWWTIRSLLLCMWCIFRIIEFRPLLQTYLNGGNGASIRDTISTSMIESIRSSRYNPGSTPNKPRFPNVMYYIPNNIFPVCVQLVIPVVLIMSLLGLSISSESDVEGGVIDFLLTVCSFHC